MDPSATDWSQPRGTTIPKETAAMGAVEAAERVDVLQAAEYLWRRKFAV